jgi:hypothetical protein
VVVRCGRLSDKASSYWLHVTGTQQIVPGICIVPVPTCYEGHYQTIVQYVLTIDCLPVCPACDVIPRTVPRCVAGTDSSLGRKTDISLLYGS